MSLDLENAIFDGLWWQSLLSNASSFVVQLVPQQKGYLPNPFANKGENK